MDRTALEMGIVTAIRHEQRPLCASCLTELVAATHGADSVDVRVVVVHLGLLGDELAFARACGRCGAAEALRNPILRLSHR